MTTPRASILTTCHNDGEYLPKSLDSALAQTEMCVEVVALDNGSTDDTWRVLQKYVADERHWNRRLDVDRLPVVVPQPVALNLLAKRANADWLIVLNADDQLAVKAVATITRIADARPDVNLIFSPWQWFGAQMGIYDFPPYTGDERMLTEHQIPGIRAVRRDLWDALGGEDETIAVGADWDWAVRGAVRGLLRPYKHPTPLWLVRHHGEKQRERLSAQCDREALRAHMARHFDEQATAA